MVEALASHHVVIVRQPETSEEEGERFIEAWITACTEANGELIRQTDVCNKGAVKACTRKLHRWYKKAARRGPRTKIVVTEHHITCLHPETKKVLAVIDVVSNSYSLHK